MAAIKYFWFCEHGFQYPLCGPRTRLKYKNWIPKYTCLFICSHACNSPIYLSKKIFVWITYIVTLTVAHFATRKVDGSLASPFIQCEWALNQNGRCIYQIMTQF